MWERPPSLSFGGQAKSSEPVCRTGRPSGLLRARTRAEQWERSVAGSLWSVRYSGKRYTQALVHLRLVSGRGAAE